jgi:hypothetical protein
MTGTQVKVACFAVKSETRVPHVFIGKFGFQRGKNFKTA